MRLLLDAQISARKVGEPLRKMGHDVLAVDGQPALEGAADEDLLELAEREGRILVTFDVKDFAPLARQWAEAARSHHGLVIAVGLVTSEFGTLLKGLEKLLRENPGEADWQGRTVFLSR